MKTGAVAKRFDVDPNTITAWTDRYSDFFSPEALGKDGKQRNYQPEDIIALNTIRTERAKNTTWEDLRAILESGYRNETLPPDFTPIDGAKAITVYTEMRELKTQLTNANAEIERLREDNTVKQNRIEGLIRESTEWRIRYEIEKEKHEPKEKPSDQ